MSWSPKEYTDAVYDSDLPPSARLLAVVLRDAFYNTRGRGKISLSLLATRSGLGLTTVKRQLATLADAGFVARKVPTKAGALAHKARTEYNLRVPAPVAHSGPQDLDSEGAPSGPSWTHSSGPQRTTGLGPQRATLKGKEAGASGRSAGAPRAAAPRVAIATAPTIDEPEAGASVIEVWAAEGADAEAVSELLWRKMDRLAANLSDQGFEAISFRAGGPPNDSVRVLVLPTNQAEASRQTIAGWCRAGGYDVRFGAPEEPSHEAVPARSSAEELV